MRRRIAAPIEEELRELQRDGLPVILPDRADPVAGDASDQSVASLALPAPCTNGGRHDPSIRSATLDDDDMGHLQDMLELATLWYTEDPRIRRIFGPLKPVLHNLRVKGYLLN